MTQAWSFTLATEAHLGRSTSQATCSMPRHGFLGLVAKDSHTVWPTGVVDGSRSDKDKGASKSLLFVHGLRSCRFPCHFSSEANSVWPTDRESQTALKAEEPLHPLTWCAPWDSNPEPAD